MPVELLGEAVKNLVELVALDPLHETVDVGDSHRLGIPLSLAALRALEGHHQHSPR